MLDKSLFIVALGCLFACGGGDDSGPAPFILPPQFDMMSPPDMSSNEMLDADQMTEISDAGMVDQTTPDAMILPQCADGEDNDGDGQTDYPLDDGCQSNEDDDEEDVPFQACEDGEDNDGDGRIDFDDPGCADREDPSENSACADIAFEDISDLVSVTAEPMGNSELSACRNNVAPEQVYLYTLRTPAVALGFDTAGSSYDTLLGIYSGCPAENQPTFCSDDVSTADKTSNFLIESPSLGDYYIVVDGHGQETGLMVLNVTRYDGDGEPCVTDEVGRSCLAGRQCIEGICVPSLCSNGVDDDADGRVDYPLDPGCESVEDATEDDPPVPTQCSDGIDNDFDGAVDYPSDANCDDAADNDERSPPVCSDGIDNDNDGLIDLEDPGCRDNPSWFSETNAPACRNAEDDDEDGFTDFPRDPGCLYPDDNDEVDPDLPSECNDGLDNDMDGLIDYPQDTDSCFYAADNQEDDPCLRVEPIDASGQSRLRGTLTLGGNNFSGACGGGSGNDVMFKYVVPNDRSLADLQLSATSSDFLAFVYVRDSCEATSERLCQSNTQISLGPQAPGTELWIFVDSAVNDTSAYRLDITATVEAGGNCAGDHYGCPPGLTCQRSAGGYRCVTSECDDGLDNDEDGITDYPDDPGCTSPDDTDERDPLADPICSNGFDDDGDGLIDFGEDPECSSASDRDERAECSDGVDNDGDGRTDYDRDADGTPDSTRDFDCVCANDASEGVNPVCGDGCDNDNDGLIDLEDPGCSDRLDNSEDNVPQCSDGIDNDMDGFSDYPNDPGCPNPSVNLELSPSTAPICADGVDNDNDDFTDFDMAGNGDDGCHSAADTDERPYCEEDIAELPLDGKVAGNTRLSPDQSMSTCSGGTSAPEQRFRLNVPYPARVTARIYDTNFSPNLYARSTCDGQTTCPDEDPDCTTTSSQLACRLFGAGSAGLLTLPQHEGELFLFVDGRANQAGDFKLDVEILYAEGDRCMTDERTYLKCENGGACLFNLQRGYATCN